MITDRLLLEKERFQAPLSQKICIEYNKLLLLVFQVSPEFYYQKIIDGTGGKVSIADIISYQIGWGELVICWYESGTQGKTSVMPGGGFETWDYIGLAQHFYAKYQFENLDEQYQEFYAVVRVFLYIVEKEYASGNLDQLGVWPWCTLQSGKQWPLSKWIAINTAAPYKRAYGLIKTLKC